MVFSVAYYDEAKDVVYCHTCLLGFKLKRMKTNSADPAFVSGMQYQNMYKNIIEIFSNNNYIASLMVLHNSINIIARVLLARVRSI